MKSVGRLLRQVPSATKRCLSSSNTSSADSSKSSGGGFFGNFFERRPIETQQQSHQTRLGGREDIIELQTHNVRPGASSEYRDAHAQLCKYVVNNRELFRCEALGNFRVLVGEEDQHVHLWRYDDGYKGADSSLTQLQYDEEYKRLRGAVAKCLRDRHNQYLMPFGFWPKVRMREESSIYEMRNYELKPGTMVEWGNYWAKAISMRDHKDKESFMGLFSQVGDLYNVRHIWCYDNLEERRAARESVWQRQQSRWEDIVANTMPLIRRMNSRIMKPMPHSPTK